MKELQARQWAVYKGMGGNHGAVQFDLQSPYWYDAENDRDYTGEKSHVVINNQVTRKLKEGWKNRDGCVFVQITSATGKNVYDWEQKILIALSVVDMGKILETLVTGNECSIVHDPNAKTTKQGDVKKYLNFKKSELGVMISATQVAGGEKRTHSVPLSVSEALILKELLMKAIPVALGW